MIDVVEAHFSTIVLSSNLFHSQLKCEGQTRSPVAQLQQRQACTKTVLPPRLSEAAGRHSLTL